MLINCQGHVRSNEGSRFRKSELEAKIRRRVACEERALRIVEKLLDNPITESYLIDSCQFITPSHYADIVDERAIIKQCGYPLCNNGLENIPKQKYHISTKNNKVYDISERKNFCSSQCFKASKYFEKQISTTPVWLRETEPPFQFKILQTDINSGSLGTEVIGSKVSPELKHDIDLLQRLDEKENKEKVPESTNDQTYPKSVVNKHSENDGQQNDILTVVSSVENLKLEEVKKHGGQDVEMHSVKDLSEDFKADLMGENGDNSTTKFLTLKADDEKLEKERSQKPASKTDYLMELLGKRKHLLRKMVDIQQPFQPVEAVRSTVDPANTELNSVLAESDVDSGTLIQERPFSDRTEIVGSDRINKSKSSSSSVIAVADSSDSQSDRVPKQVGHQVTSPSKLHQLFPNISPPLALVWQRLSEWVTRDTLRYLGMCDIELVENTNESQIFKTQGDIFQQKYVALGKRLDAELTLASEQNSDSSPGLSGTPTMAVPDIEELKQNTTDFTFKVREYYKGSYTYSTPSAESEDKQQSGISTDEDADKRVPVLPPVDSSSQGVIRCKIVLQRLDKSIPELLNPLNLSIQHVASELRELVKTFSLGSKNITFKPGEWTLVALLLLKMLSRKISIVRESFLEQRAVNFLQILLKPLVCSPTEVDQMVSLLLESPLSETNPVGPS